MTGHGPQGHAPQRHGPQGHGPRGRGPQGHQESSPEELSLKSCPQEHVTSESPVGDISVVTLIRTDTTLDHSQKAEKVRGRYGVKGSWQSVKV